LEVSFTTPATVFPLIKYTVSIGSGVWASNRQPKLRSIQTNNLTFIHPELMLKYTRLVASSQKAVTFKGLQP